MSVRTRIEINPNLRVDGDCTIASLDDDVYGARPKVLETVEVFESTSGLQGRGWVREIDLDDRTVTLIVDWANLDIPSTHSVSTPRAHLANMYLEVGERPQLDPTTSEERSEAQERIAT